MPEEYIGAVVLAILLFCALCGMKFLEEEQ